MDVKLGLEPDIILDFNSYSWPQIYLYIENDVYLDMDMDLDFAFKFTFTLPFM